MKYSIICLKKFSGTLKFSVLQLKLIFNSQQNFNMMISAAQNFWFMYTSIIEENCCGLDQGLK